MVQKLTVSDLAGKSLDEAFKVMLFKLNELIDAHEFWVDSMTEDD